ncbi:uncharacterized protein F4822DRAFT_372752 [Hypoxylon trugodes]|uniref:uncharacterized protein n=1 Tax=Hypoxylon trugodes TaxID=326681 RepID=UPI00219DB1E6|nr:uncharacterized protein F4822DRAFT_372752 [Hypoxylon trugodes]KAI1384758.1 hypothetical protein F4822DRAFT_372752 [Hypoxylon trugodes]
MLNLKDDPLKKVKGEYIILEWLDLGTLSNFISNGNRLGIQRLPNRLLYRFFLCLTRMCIALAYPPGRTDDEEVTEEVQDDVIPTNITHNDLHDGNILLGDPPADEEHEIAPIIKAIDFGLATENSYADLLGTGQERNIFYIGGLMLELVAMDQTVSPFDIDPDNTEIVQWHDGETGEDVEFEAQSVGLLLPFRGPQDPMPWLDTLLKQLICRCLANIAERPSLRELRDELVGAMAKTGGSYGDPDGFESDTNVWAIWRAITTYEPPPEYPE